MAKNEELIVGLDIGTTKIAAVVGELTETGIDIIGVGTHPSRGLKKGVVTNIDKTVASIQQAVEEAKHMAGCEITSVYVGIAGAHIQGLNSRGMVAVKDREVQRTDVSRVLDAARAVPVSADREILHVLPREYIVDSQDGIRDPVGMAGVRLEANVHIVTGSVTSAQNIIKCCNRCNLSVADIVLEPVASAEAVLHEDEKELGVVLVDIGGGTTDIAIFSEGGIVHSASLALGGHHLNLDIACGLNTPIEEAEKIKKRYGCAMTSLIDREETIEVSGLGGRPPSVLRRHILGEILEPRVEEIFQLVQREIARSGYEDRISSGAVITGGSTLLEGMEELAAEVLGMPIRRGAPRSIGGLVDVVRSPMFSTGVGLVLYGARSGAGGQFRVREDNAYSKVKSRMKAWLSEIF